MGEWVVTGRRPVAGVLSAAAAAAGFLGIALGLPAVAADTSGASASTSEARKVARGEGGGAAAMPSLWSTTARLRGGVGVKDNPQLSTLNAQSSGFASLAAEVSSLRIPLDGPEVALFGTVEHTEYYQDELEPETVGLADARWEGSIADDWSLTAQGGYVFLRQVFDASEIEGVPFVVRAEGHAGSLKPGVKWKWAEGWRAEVEVEGTRQWLAEPLDGFVDLSPRLTLVRSWDRDHQVSASYRQRDRRFDTRTAVDLDGDPIVGRLRVAQHEVELNWRRTWGATRAWRATLRAGWVQSADNGVGYLDYERFTGASTLRWAKGRWEWRGEFRSRWYRYAVQESDSLAGGPRRRWEAGYSLRGEWKMRDSLTWFGQYEGELTDENVSAGDYRVNALSGGLEWEW